MLLVVVLVMGDFLAGGFVSKKLVGLRRFRLLLPGRREGDG